MEQALEERLVPVGIGAGEVETETDGGGGGGHQGQVKAEFAVMPIARQVAPVPGQEVQGEIDSGDEHEDHGDQFDGIAVEIADAGVVGREAADGYGGEGMPDGVKGGHARQPIGQGAGDGQPEVDIPQGLGGLGDARGELVVLDRPGGLGPVELHAADAEHGQDGHRQDDDAHAPQPLQLLAVVEDGGGQRVQTDDDRRPGGGQAGDGLEGGVGDGQVGLRGEDEGQGAGQAQHAPEQGHHQEAVPQLELVAPFRHRQPDEGAQAQEQDQGGEKGLRRAIRVVIGNPHRGQHGQAEEHQQQPQHLLDRGEFHGRDLRPRRGTR